MKNDDFDNEHELPLSESKTQRKKNMLALQKLGEQLVELTAGEFAKIPLEAELLEALAVARKLTIHSPKRRQMRYVSQLLNNVDVAPIKAALDKLQQGNQASNAKFQQVEYWRDTLIKNGDSDLGEFIQRFPDINRQHLRQLIRNAQQEIQFGKNKGGATMLFRYLRSIIVET